MTTSLASYASTTATYPRCYAGCCGSRTRPCGCSRRSRQVTFFRDAGDWACVTDLATPSATLAHTTFADESVGQEYFIWAGPFLNPNPVPQGDDGKAESKAQKDLENAPVARFGHGAENLTGRDTVLSQERSLVAPWGCTDEFDTTCLFHGQLRPVWTHRIQRFGGEGHDVVFGVARITTTAAGVTAGCRPPRGVGSERPVTVGRVICHACGGGVGTERSIWPGVPGGASFDLCGSSSGLTRVM